MTSTKVASTIIFGLFLSPQLYAYTYMEVDPNKLQFFNASSYSANTFFYEHNRRGDQLVLRMHNPSGQHITNEWSWQVTGLNAQSFVHGGIYNYVRIGDGQCVDFVKHMTNTQYISSTSWIKGDQVTAFYDPNALTGKPIATFTSSDSYGNPNGGYGHAAIILSAWKENGSPTVNAVWVVDQNSLPVASPTNGGSVAKRTIRIGGSGVNNLNNYFTIKY